MQYWNAVLRVAVVTLALVAGCVEREGEGLPEKVTGAANPLDVDLEERDRLRALGYVGVGEPLAASVELGVVKFDRERAQPGLNLFTNAEFCTAQLIDLDGTVQHAWSQEPQEPCNRWSGAFLAPNGDLLVIGRAPHDRKSPDSFVQARFMLRLSWHGDLLWNRRIPVHHDLDLQPDGRIFSLDYRHRMLPEIHKTIAVRDHSLVLMSAEGEVLEEASLYEMLTAAGDILNLAQVEPRKAERRLEVDLIHANSVERMPYPELAQRGTPYGVNHVLVCLRSQDLLVVVDWPERRIVWAWGAGELSGPHDANWLPNGNILAFDNGLGRDWSRVIEIDPVTRKIVWQYHAPEPTDLYTKTQGTNQRLANGNTLITDSDSGRVFEVTAQGKVVWEFRNFNLTEKREPSVIPRLRRLEGLDFAGLTRAIEAGDALPHSD